VLFIVFLCKLHRAEVYWIADVSEECAASVICLEVIMEVVTSFGMRFLLPTTGLDKLKMEISHNSLMLHILRVVALHTKILFTTNA
jgi:hypothetical protein